MLNIFNGLLLIGIIFLSTPLEAKTIKLGPNESKTLANNAPFALTATCSVHGTHPIHSKIRILVLKNKGTINGHNLSSGQGTSVLIKNESTILVSADSGAQINLSNLSSEPLEAVCTL